MCRGMSISLKAQSYVPQSDQSIVTSWTVPPASQQTKVFIVQLLNDASLPGLASRYYGRASALLKPLLAADPDDQQLKYYQATVLQYYHQFSQAQQILNDILQRQPDNRSAWLMKANIYLVQGELAQAKSACLQLLGQGSLVISTVCVLEVTAEQGQVAKSYQQLQNVVKMAGAMPSEQRLWMKKNFGFPGPIVNNSLNRL
ncbi:MAG: putative Zn-dependent protease [Paraglaciecola sp.]|jgi:predicted Zn-dependent protease